MSVQKLLSGARRGFSLIEVLMGLVILLIALSAAAALSISNARLVAINQQRVHAANLAEAKLEELRNADFNTVVDGADATALTSNGGTTNGIFTRNWSMFPDSPEIGLKRVIVSVTWQQFGGSQTYEVQGVIGP